MTLESYIHAIQRAMTVFQATDLFYAMRRAAMAGRYHWRQSIEPYSQLYRKVVTGKEKQHTYAVAP
ncbi:hypothetical protein [Modicisalibacter luteus]